MSLEFYVFAVGFRPCKRPLKYSVLGVLDWAYGTVGGKGGIGAPFIMDHLLARAAAGRELQPSKWNRQQQTY